jgi:hypothetical protein
MGRQTDRRLHDHVRGGYSIGRASFTKSTRVVTLRTIARSSVSRTASSVKCSRDTRRLTMALATVIG